MVQLIVGRKGKGKTKHLLDKVNGEVKTASGNIVYLDKSVKHMYELNNRIRLVDVLEFSIQNSDEFIGFLLGIISQDHDLEQVYLDSFLKIAKLEGEDADVASVIGRLDEIGAKFGVDFILSVSKDEYELPDSVKDKILLSL